MTEQEHYSLRWNNHQNHILRAFDALLQTKTLVDVTLVCAETSIRAHKVVLSACSPFFQRVFADTPCKHPVIVLKDFRGWVVQAIVDFMYRGEISVPQERLQILIQAGESLQVRGLVDHPMSEITPTPAASPLDDDFLDTSHGSPRTTAAASRYDEIMNESLPLRIPSSTTATPTIQIPKPFPSSETTITQSKTNSILPPPTTTTPNSDHSAATPTTSASTTSPAINPNLNLEAPEPCTSPMPRRKQARPRRCSGECGPHDLSSNTKSTTTPEPTNLSTSSTDTNTNCERTSTISQQEQQDQIDADIRETLDKIKTSNEERPESSCLGEEDMDQDDDEDEEELLNHSHDDLEDELNSEPDKEHQAAATEGPENLCTKGPSSSSNTNNNNNPSTENNENNNRIVLSLKDIRHLNRPAGLSRSDPHTDSTIGGASSSENNHLSRSHGNLMDFPHPGHPAFMHQGPNSGNGGSGGGGSSMKRESRESFESRLGNESPFLDHMDITLAAAHHHHQSMMQSQRMHMDAMEREMHKDYTPSSPMSLPSHFNPHDGPPHPPSPLPFPGMSLTSPHHMFGLDSPLGLFPPGIDPAKLYNPLMEMSDPRGMHPDHQTPYLKKKGGRPKGQHSAPRGGPPRSWTNAELTDALQHVWNKKMTTSQASRIFGIPYNSLLMYVRGKYGKSLKLEQLRRDCISGPPIELLQMGIHNNNNVKGHKMHMKDNEMGAGHPRSSSSEPDLLPSPNQMFNPFQHGFYPDFPFPPGLPLNMLNLLPDRHPPGALNMSIDEDCKSDQSKHSLEEEYPGADAAAAAAAAAVVASQMNMRAERERSDRREMMLAANGQD